MNEDNNQGLIAELQLHEQSNSAGAKNSNNNNNQVVQGLSPEFKCQGDPPTPVNKDASSTVPTSSHVSVDAVAPANDSQINDKFNYLIKKIEN